MPDERCLPLDRLQSRPSPPIRPVEAGALGLPPPSSCRLLRRFRLAVGPAQALVVGSRGTPTFGLVDNVVSHRRWSGWTNTIGHALPTERLFRYDLFADRSMISAIPALFCRPTAAACPRFGRTPSRRMEPTRLGRHLCLHNRKRFDIDEQLVATRL